MARATVTLLSRWSTLSGKGRSLPHRPDARSFLAAPTTAEEKELSALFAAYTDPRSGGLGTVLRNPARAVRALATMLRLPRLDVDLTDSPDAAAIRERMRRIAGLGSLPFLREVTDVLPLPETAADFSRGRGRQTLRQRAKAAQRAGVTWHAVDDMGERHALLELATQLEQTHPMEQYRSKDPDNSDFAQYSEWLVAESHTGEPLFLAAIAIDGEWALQRYFRTLGHDGIHSDTRFLMAQVVVEQLVRHGVRYVFNADAPFTVSPGLRHFQRMLGWRICRMRFVRQAPRAAGGNPVQATRSSTPSSGRISASRPPR